MGLFSWKCSKTDIPVICDVGAETKDECAVVVLMENGQRIEGDYDGYGRVDDYDIQDRLNADEARWVLKCFYEGERFEDLKRSPHDPGQGYFYEPGSIARMHDAYRQKLAPAVPAKPRKVRLSTAKRQALRGCAIGFGPMWGATIQSHWGGREQTIRALREAGLITKSSEITRNGLVLLYAGRPAQLQLMIDDHHLGGTVVLGAWDAVSAGEAYDQMAKLQASFPKEAAPDCTSGHGRDHTVLTCIVIDGDRIMTTPLPGQVAERLGASVLNKWRIERPDPSAVKFRRPTAMGPFPDLAGKE